MLKAKHLHDIGLAQFHGFCLKLRKLLIPFWCVLRCKNQKSVTSYNLTSYTTLNIDFTVNFDRN